MTVKEFLNCMDFSKANKIPVLLIPINEKYPIDPKDFDKFTLSKTKKVIFDDDKYGFPEGYDDFIDRYGFKPCRASNKKSDEGYDYVDLQDLIDEYYYIHDKNNNVWILNTI